MRFRVWVGLATLGCAIALAACGGSDSSSDSGAGSVTAFCDKVNAVKGLDNPFANVQPGDVQGAKDALDKFRSELASVVDAAPAEIKPDVDKVQSTIDDFASKVSTASTPQDLLKAAQSFQGQAASLQATNAHIKQYVDQNCKS